MTKTPDIEIYLMKATPDAVLAWLSSELGEVQQSTSKGSSQQWLINGIEVVYTPEAEGKFGCLWIKQNLTHWNDDLDCARSAHPALDCEVRCAARMWSESAEDDQPGWIKLTRGQEKAFEWD
ncbi:hypothetical protein [Oceanobacter mangrovi]|uniref:hypothetical protein n=1 Tax=Oceanobacter mangrovi TaxID=2862510 RepID=UPI001C8D2D7E|nr:hypothetical protein [Oceanobacter mangrovi]